ncbi:hypothetical protein LWI28_013738 [Acer negundo]|uniref:Uncharacterized protein n=1 Tax=Acer negundo TaxID=4023 RepID=A0AAD5NZ53_ACENE|nr:hypothetical protein LWI28_013738 [Acer negundo]
MDAIDSQIVACGGLLHSWNIKKKAAMRRDINERRDALREAGRRNRPTSWRNFWFLEHQLDSALSIEERYLRQRAKVDWLKNGTAEDSASWHYDASGGYWIGQNLRAEWIPRRLVIRGVPINYVSRGSNQVAHGLAMYAIRLDEDMYWMED